jgi:hypothetical protein
MIPTHYFSQTGKGESLDPLETGKPAQNIFRTLKRNIPQEIDDPRDVLRCRLTSAVFPVIDRTFGDSDHVGDIPLQKPEIHSLFPDVLANALWELWISLLLNLDTRNSQTQKKVGKGRRIYAPAVTSATGTAPAAVLPSRSGSTRGESPDRCWTGSTSMWRSPPSATAI